MKKLTTIILLMMCLVSYKHLSSQECGYDSSSKSVIYQAGTIPSFLKIYDRFGREFKLRDILIDSSNNGNGSTDTAEYGLYSILPSAPPYCDQGMFRIYFAPDLMGIGFSNQAYRNVVCRVFKDLNRLLSDANPSNTGRVKIWVGSNSAYNSFIGNWPSSAHKAISSAFRVIPGQVGNEYFDNEVAKTIKSGYNSYAYYPPEYMDDIDVNAGFYHGYITINFTDFEYHDDYSTASVGSGQLDLYTVVLHEAFHLLGFESLINKYGLSNLGNNRYSVYDQYLTWGNNAANKLLGYNTTTGNLEYKYAGNIPNRGCSTTTSIFYNGLNLTGQAVYSNSNIGSWTDLSHFSCSNQTGCQGYATNAVPTNNYIMTPCMDLGANYLKRHPSDNEVKVLCDLGYPLRNINNIIAFGDYPPSGSLIYKTYNACSVEGCSAVARNDGVFVSDESQSGYIHTYAPFNDFPPLNGGYDDTRVKGHPSSAFRYIDPTLGFGIRYDRRFINTSGDAVITYYPKCPNGKRGSLGYIFSTHESYPEPPLCPDNNNCNYVCNGDFETGNISTNFRIWFQDFPFPFPIPRPSWLTDFRWSMKSFTGCIVTPNVPSPDPTSWYKTEGYAQPIGDVWRSFSITIPAHSQGGNNYAMIMMKKNAGETYVNNGFYLKLRSPLKAGQTYTLKFLGRGLDWQVDAHIWNSGRLEVFGSGQAPCPPPQHSDMSGAVSSCGFQADLLGRKYLGSSTSWTQESMTITPMQDMNYIVIRHDYSYYPLSPGLLDPAHTYLIDNVEIYHNQSKPLVISATNVNNPPCILNTKRITYAVKLASGTSGVLTNLKLKAVLPSGFSIANTGDFDAQGEMTINASVSSTNTATINLDFTIDPNVIASGTFHDIGLKILSNNVCIDPSSTSHNLNLRIDYGSPIVINETITHDICNQGRGSISLSVSGGTPPYNYYWSNGRVSQSNIGLTAGSYSVTVVDNMGCGVTKNFVIYNQETELAGYIQNRYISCNGQAVLTYIKQMATDNYTYLWSTGATTNSITVNSATATLYTLTVTNAQGCSKVYNVNIGPSAYITIGSGVNIPTLSQAISSGIMGGNISNGISDQVDKKFKIVGNFTLDLGSAMFHACEFQMGAGSQIIIPPSITNTYDAIFRYCNFYTCGNQLAKGIFLANGSSIFLESSEIRDCYKALEVTGNPSYMMTHTNTFIDNVLGMYFNNSTYSSPTSARNKTGLWCPPYGNVFTSSTSSMKQPCCGMVSDNRKNLMPNFSYFSKPWAGIFSHGVEDISIGVSGQKPNEFSNIQNGIIVYSGGSQKIENCKFSNIQPYTGSSGAAAYGILVWEDYPTTSSPLRRIDLYGLGTRGADPTTMNNVKTGIYIMNMMVGNLTNFKMTNILNEGIIYKPLTQYASYYSRIANNSIHTKGTFGIVEANTSLGPSNSYIQNNTISVGTPLTGTNEVCGIQVASPSGSINHKIAITGNNISCLTGSRMDYGIRAINVSPTATNGLSLANNTIQLASPHKTKAGILAYSTKKTQIDQNTIMGYSRTMINTYNGMLDYTPKGIHILNSEGAYTCNTADNMPTGIQFSQKCNNSDLRSNNVNRHLMGLYLENYSELNTQASKGNRFLGSPTTCNQEAYRDQKNSIKTMFTVGAVGSASVVFVPNPVTPPFNSSQRFFMGTGTNPYNCTLGGGTPTSGGVVIIGRPETGIGRLVPVEIGTSEFVPIGKNNTLLYDIPLSSYDTAVLTRSLSYPSYQAELRYQNQKATYRKLLPFKTNLEEGSIYAQFLQETEATTLIDEHLQIEALEAAIATLHPADEQAIAGYQSTVETILSQIYHLDSIIATDTLARDSYVAQRASLRSDMETTYSAMEAIYAAHAQEVAGHPAAMDALNHAANPSNISETYQRDLYDILQPTYTAGSLSLSPSQQQVLYTIAHSCPLIHTDVVHRARTLMGYYTDTIVYNDSLLCSILTTEPPTLLPTDSVDSTSSSDPILFPNPAENEVSIYFPMIPTNSLNFVITDMQGQIQYTENDIALSTHYHSITLPANLTNGLYLLNIYEGGNLLYSKQFEIIR